MNTATTTKIANTLHEIQMLDQNAMTAARARVDFLTKPPGSLGELEEMAIRLAGIQRTAQPTLVKKAVTVMCGDHGVTEEGVSAFASELTGMMMGNFTREGAAINVFSRQMGADVIVVDVGSACETPAGVRNEKVKNGTDNMAKGSAMSREEAMAAIEVGIRLAEELASQGYQAVALGDMGIGNTTPSAALVAAVAGKAVAEITGCGTGLDEEKRQAKAVVIERSLRINDIDSSWRDRMDAIEVLARVGGLEIAGLAGVTLGAAACGMAVIVDGVIAGAAAMMAFEICENVQGYLFASHLSQEPAHGAALAHMSLTPVLHLQMRLGEGSGAVLLYPLLEASLRMMYEMATFSDIGL
ncbi:nicotinate-nucleotide-dimethylbenzimidazole phosphoribosyltransferase [Aneurinibacillus soli]|uniref:Nicotinate-nucleotide--dimethylbenzimidazole phosphoribosyltransferase n=1 Tax=Aneurinibacillus soli TaxID=1500254 RepID=A0A0U4WD34_9BACL|nr:nicotinate-nucleotide--dimethylbenzimidazole phosphoribosyltransferase [Aneurinibacillus soli]PYE59297.1 nicotinate-nucleotide-dimethylbenzimidazole phosphoribosyltransferase [Aneurinibacillus soli]BAU26713.1 Nicotinate-nucleotide--dimethylbenzimidazole phosphoribosyltransferase [Aneurinibacillus soli]